MCDGSSVQLCGPQQDYRSRSASWSVFCPSKPPEICVLPCVCVCGCTNVFRSTGGAIHTSGGAGEATCAWQLTRAEWGDIVRAGEVERGPGDVHHVVIVAGGVQAVEAPAAVARVLPHPEACGGQRDTGDVSTTSTTTSTTSSGERARKGRATALPDFVQK